MARLPTVSERSSFWQMQRCNMSRDSAWQKVCLTHRDTQADSYCSLHTCCLWVWLGESVCNLNSDGGKTEAEHSVTKSNEYIPNSFCWSVVHVHTPHSAVVLVTTLSCLAQRQPKNNEWLHQHRSVSEQQPNIGLENVSSMDFWQSIAQSRALLWVIWTAAIRPSGDAQDALCMAHFHRTVLPPVKCNYSASFQLEYWCRIDRNAFCWIRKTYISEGHNRGNIGKPPERSNVWYLREPAEAFIWWVSDNPGGSGRSWSVAKIIHNLRPAHSQKDCLREHICFDTQQTAWQLEKAFAARQWSDHDAYVQSVKTTAADLAFGLKRLHQLECAKQDHPWHIIKSARSTVPSSVLVKAYSSFSSN